MEKTTLKLDEAEKLVVRKDAIARLITNEDYKEVIESDYFGVFRQTLYDTAQGLKNTLDEAEALGVEEDRIERIRNQYIEVIKHIEGVDCFYKFLQNSLTLGKEAQTAIDEYNQENKEVH